MRIGFGAPRTFTARYTSDCAADCGHDITPGDEARYNDVDEVVHADCPPMATVEMVPVTDPTCPDCWTEHAGECL